MKCIQRIYDIELKMREVLGIRFTYIGCYFLGFVIGKIIF